MTIVDEAMARLRRDRPEMSRQSEEYVEGLLKWAIRYAFAKDREIRRHAHIEADRAWPVPETD